MAGAIALALGTPVAFSDDNSNGDGYSNGTGTTYSGGSATQKAAQKSVTY
jgi:hypothetical protein